MERAPPSRTESLTYSLNPADYVLLVSHELLRRQGYCGLCVMIIADLAGPLDPGRLATAIRQLGKYFPALSAHIRFVPLLQRPYWHIEHDACFEEAVEYAFHHVDPESDDPWAPFNRAINDPVDVRQGPQLRLVHVQLGKDRHRLGLRWAHPLMDIEGGHALLGALHELLCGRTPALSPDPRARFPDPFNLSLFKSILRGWHGRHLYAGYDRYHQPRIVSTPENASQTCRLTLRTYSAEQRQRFEALAKERTQPGPLRYSRAMLVALARTYHAMATRQGRPRSHYLFPLPVPAPRSGPRPGVCGNYVTIPWIIFPAKDLDDWTKSDATATLQFQDYFKKHRDHAMWSMYRSAAGWPLGLTCRLMTHRYPRAAAGFTGYQFDNSVTHLGTAKVINLAGAGPMSCHPGWMFGRTTFGDLMNLSITYFEDYFDTPNVERFFDLVEKELFGRSA